MSQDYNTRETLLMRLKNRQDDDDAWQDFHQIYKGFIWSIIIKMGIPSGDQDDLVQEVLLKAWQALPRFEYDRERGKFRTWLSRVTSNTARTYFRKHNRKSKLFSDVESDQGVEAEIEKISAEEWKKFIADMAWKNVSTNLSEVVKDTFRLLSEGCSTMEISEELNIPYNTVSVYKRRVIAKIAKEIAELEIQLG